jgi:hypothetical protein
MSPAPTAARSVDLASALRIWLRAGPTGPDDLAGLTHRAGYGADIYWPVIPGGTPMPKHALAFRVTGGPQTRSTRIGRARVETRGYGTDEEQALRVQRALYDRLHGATTIRIPQGGGYVGILGAWRETDPAPNRDPATGWHFSYALYTITYATTPLAG